LYAASFDLMSMSLEQLLGYLILSNLGVINRYYFLFASCLQD
jgi:hypothetical protein